MNRVAVIAWVSVLLLVAGCGSTSGEDRPEEDVTLMLDRRPNATHAGIYTAVARGYDAAEGANVTIETPRSAADPLRRLEGGDVDFAVLPIGALARSTEAVGVAAVDQSPAGPGLVLATQRTTVDEEPEVVRALIRGLQRGYKETQTDPDSSVADMLEAEPELDRAELTRQLDGVDASFTGDKPYWGPLDRAAIEASGKVDDVASRFDFGLVRAPEEND